MFGQQKDNDIQNLRTTGGYVISGHGNKCNAKDTSLDIVTPQTAQVLLSNYIIYACKINDVLIFSTTIYHKRKFPLVKKLIVYPKLQHTKNRYNIFFKKFQKRNLLKQKRILETNTNKLSFM